MPKRREREVDQRMDVGDSKTKTVSFSELSDLRQCGFKWSLSYAERWTAPTTAMALSRGTLFHAVLEDHYKVLAAKQSASAPTGGVTVRGDRSVAEIARELGAKSLAEAENFAASVDLVEWMCEGYFDYYAEADTHMEIISCEKMIDMPLGVGVRSGITFRLKGKIDMVVRDWELGGGLWIYDHKTCANLPKGFDVDLDDQMGLYAALLADAGTPVDGVVYDAVRTTRNKDSSQKGQPYETRFKRIPTSRSAGELEQIKLDALSEFDRVWADILLTRERPPRRPNTDTCKWKCAYTEACLATRRPDRSVTDLLYDMDFRRREPSGGGETAPNGATA